ncbi:hypothetical protein ALO_15867 [Acetonema longum DSM 6540]|uniref:Uncharacterized protein n=1 Tax=Acetonema longum DSM 6540 TaxID=1009370 RepID=F7NM47_9FIRM|nr:hypothetical protein ALO_15867 [Acetonema longum DSM 6540]
MYATFSVVAGLYLILIPPGESFIQRVLHIFIQNAEIIFMAFLIIYFVLSLRAMNILIKNLHSPQGMKTDEEIKDLKRQIMNNGEK